VEAHSHDCRSFRLSGLELGTGRRRADLQPNDVVPGNVPPVGKSRVLSMSAAVAAVALSVTPGVAVANPAGKRSSHSVVSYPLLALQMSEQAISPFSHYSHSSHVSHSSHYSGSHNSHSSHSSHTSHYSSSPTTPPPPPPTSAAPTQNPAPSPTQSQTSGQGGNGGAGISSGSPSPSGSQSTSQSPTPTATNSTITPQPASDGSSDDDAVAGVIIGLAVLGGATFFIYRRNSRTR
jgi:hypothetical protein